MSRAIKRKPLTLQYDASRKDKNRYALVRGKRVVVRFTFRDLERIRESALYIHGE